MFGEGSLLGVLCGLSNWCVLPVVMGETGTEHGTELVEKRHAISLMYSTYFGKQVGGQTKTFKAFPFWIKGLRKKMIWRGREVAIFLGRKSNDLSL